MILVLDQVRVHDVLHQGILSCTPDAPLDEVSRIMATHRVHAVGIADSDSSQPDGVISDGDAIAAISGGAER